MKKLVVLEICEHEPSSHHHHIFKNDNVDFFYVSYLKNSTNAISFNYQKSWAYNRNSLIENITSEYEYYMFVDYDIEFTSKTTRSVIDEILYKLDTYKPLMYRPCGFRDDQKKNHGVYCGGFINHAITILHNSVIDYVFPLPTFFGGFWDAASWINSIVVPFNEENILVDYDIKTLNTKSSKYIHNSNKENGLRSMNELFLLTKLCFNNKTIHDFKTVNDFKNYYMYRRKLKTENKISTNLSFNNNFNIYKLDKLKMDINISNENKRWDLINYIIKKTRAKKYLEIGVRKGSCFTQIDIEYKVSVDPAPDNFKVTHQTTSDDFFKNNKESFDLIFIDGLHYSKQVYKDINNSLKFLNPNGIIVCHDMLPKSYISQKYPMIWGTKTWNGDCWKAWHWLRTERNDLDMFVVDTDNGCGIIKRGQQETIKLKRNIDYFKFKRNKELILNLKTPTFFYKYFDLINE